MLSGQGMLQTHSSRGKNGTWTCQSLNQFSHLRCHIWFWVGWCFSSGATVSLMLSLALHEVHLKMEKKKSTQSNISVKCLSQECFSNYIPVCCVCRTKIMEKTRLSSYFKVKYYLKFILWIENAMWVHECSTWVPGTGVKGLVVRRTGWLYITGWGAIKGTELIWPMGGGIY